MAPSPVKPPDGTPALADTLTVAWETHAEDPAKLGLGSHTQTLRGNVCMCVCVRACVENDGDRYLVLESQDLCPSGPVYRSVIVVSW